MSETFTVRPAPSYMAEQLVAKVAQLYRKRQAQFTRGDRARGIATGRAIEDQLESLRCVLNLWQRELAAEHPAKNCACAEISLTLCVDGVKRGCACGGSK